MTKPKLSIIIPCYNTADYISRTLTTLFSQNFNDFEVIIVDDNSCDEIDKVIAHYQTEKNKLKFIKNIKNSGPGICRNIGIELSRGEFITFLDSDDWIDTYGYITAIDIFKANETCDFIIWGIKNERSNSAYSSIRTEYKKSTYIKREFAMALLCNTYSTDITISSYLGNKMFRKSILKDIRFTQHYFEDVEFTFKTIFKSQGICLLPNIYTHYLQRDKSIVHSFGTKHINDMFQVLANIRDFIKVNNNVFYNDFCSLVEKLSKTIFKILYSNIYDISEQKKLLSIFFSKLSEFCEIDKILNYLDAERLKNILLNF